MTSPDTEFVSILGAAGSPEAPPRVSSASLPEMLPILGLSALAAVYGGEYLLAYREKKSLGPPWFFYNLLVASMVLVVVGCCRLA